ncbi:hypothetical protein [Streptomyces sp. NPDC046821]|uniref:hypothetical protein n=1 Tax=Streptomyces sp. NPDC046821 TaxID=3154702 RepID=UPI0033D086D1
MFAPDAGAFEGAVAAGGWGLSLLPVHCVPKSRAAGAVGAGRRSGRGARGSTAGGAAAGSGEAPRAGRAGRRGQGRGRGWVTRAWRRRRSGGGSGLS